MARDTVDAQQALSTSWHSYPSIYALGHRYAADLLLDDVLVQEKVDGSQFSFGYFPGHPDFPDGWRFRSKGAEIQPLAPPDMFKGACQHVRTLPLHPGWTYRGECLAKPKHNALAYDRAPNGNVIVFDINDGHESYLPYAEVVKECERLGLEVVPCFYQGRVESAEQVRKFLDTVSVLGGQKIEGVVIKNYARFGLDKKALMGKFVSEAFKEVHSGEWRKENPKSGDILDVLTERYKTPARWAKAVQHLRDAGSLDNSPKDIGLLMKEVPEDIKKECEAEIKDQLWAWAWAELKRRTCGGLPEWYKQQLLEQQFATGEVSVTP